MKPTSAILLSLAAVLLPAPAIAHGEVAAVIVYGPAKPQQREVVLSTVQQALRSASWTVQDQPWTGRDHEAVVACLALDRPWPCVAATARSKGVDRLVIIHIATDKVEKGLVLTGQVLVAGDAVPATDRGWCSNCSDATLASSTSELASQLLKHEEARRQRADRPPEKPASIPTSPVPAATAAPLQPSPTAPSSPPAESPRSRLVPAVVIGAGVAALGLGGYLAYQAKAPSEGPQTQYVYSGPGIGLGIAGGVAVGVGIYLWFRSAPRDSTARASAPLLAPAAGGAVAGWITAF